MSAKKTTRQRRKSTKPQIPQAQQALDAPSPSAAALDRARSVRSFALSFFETFQIPVRQDEGAGGPLHVDLPPEMAEHFGAQALRLVFQSGEVTSDTDLVAFGSRIFDRMMAYLDQHSAVTVQQLPALHSAGEELLRAVHLRNAALADLRMSESQSPLYLFNWHITYRADDKQEEIFTVALDERQRRIPLPPSEHESSPEHEAGQGLPPLAELLAQAQPISPGLDEEGNPLPLRLPPMTQLSRLAERARQYALYHADVRCVSHETDILPRLHKSLTRLTNYYQQQIQEVYDAHDPTWEKRQALQEDLQRKIQEEVENHRLRVKVRLFSYAILYVPVATASMRLSDGVRSVEIQVVRNRFTGALNRPACYACGDPITELVICREGHVACETCSGQCQSCHDTLCAGCGLHTCPVCQGAHCETCSQLCWVCGEHACAAHISPCPICADEVCHACQEECAVCGVRQCRSHLRRDGVTDQWICGECAVRCPHCQGYSSQMVRCARSGQRFCQNCATTCSKCGDWVGPGFFTVDQADQQPYCRNCMQTCPTCGRPAGALLAGGCSQCGNALCANCCRICTICGVPLCADHSQECTDCGGSLCPAHQSLCLIGGEILCPECKFLCPICESLACAEHQATCDVCGQTSCQECLFKGVCLTCRALVRSQQIVSIQDELAGDPRLKAFLTHYRWVKTQNFRYTYYLGTDRQDYNLILVVEEGRVIANRRAVNLRGRLG